MKSTKTTTPTKSALQNLLALPVVSSCYSMLSNIFPTSFEPPPCPGAGAASGGWVGKGRAEKSEETSAAEIDLNFDVVQMGFMSSYVALAADWEGLDGLKSRKNMSSVYD